MKRVGVRDFRDHATQYLAGDEVLAIERHGQPIGFYIPARTKRPEASVALFERLDRAIERVLAQTGFSEEDLVRFFDLSQSVPEVGTNPREERGVVPSAPGR